MRPGPFGPVDAELWLRMSLLRPELYPEGSHARANAEAINREIERGFRSLLPTDFAGVES